MTQFNIFCYSQFFADENSFQQDKYRAFNKKVSEKRYYEIKKEVFDVFNDIPRVELSDFWEFVTKKHWEKLLKIPEATDFKKGFRLISGRKINV
jgi:hypothetical protein